MESAELWLAPMVYSGYSDQMDFIAMLVHRGVFSGNGSDDHRDTEIASLFISADLTET